MIPDPFFSRNFEQPFKSLVGAAHHVRKACEDMGKCWVHGISQCERYSQVVKPFSAKRKQGELEINQFRFFFCLGLIH